MKAHVNLFDQRSLRRCGKSSGSQVEDTLSNLPEIVQSIIKSMHLQHLVFYCFLRSAVQTQITVTTVIDKIDYLYSLIKLKYT